MTKESEIDAAPCVGCICFPICVNKDWINFFLDCRFIVDYYLENKHYFKKVRTGCNSNFYDFYRFYVETKEIFKGEK